MHYAHILTIALAMRLATPMIDTRGMFGLFASRNARCTEDKFPCPNSKICITTSAVCDGIYDCPGGQDEDSCSGSCTNTTTKFRINCGPGTFRCITSNNTCVPINARCDGDSDCPCGDDEAYCNTAQTATIPYPMAFTSLMAISQSKNPPPVKSSTILIQTSIPAADMEAIGFHLDQLTLDQTSEPEANVIKRTFKTQHDLYRKCLDKLPKGPALDPNYITVCDALKPKTGGAEFVRFRKSVEVCIGFILVFCSGGGGDADTDAIKKTVKDLQRDTRDIKKLATLNKDSIIEAARIEKQDFQWTKTEFNKLGGTVSALGKLIRAMAKESYLKTRISIASQLARGYVPDEIFAKNKDRISFYEELYKNKGYLRNRNVAYNMHALSYGKANDRLWIVGTYAYMNKNQRAFDILPLPQQIMYSRHNSTDALSCVRPHLKATQMVLTSGSTNIELWDQSGPILGIDMTERALACEALVYMEAAAKLSTQRVGDVMPKIITDLIKICPSIRFQYLSTRCVEEYAPGGLPGVVYNARKRTLRLNRILVFTQREPIYVPPHIPKPYHPSKTGDTFDFDSYVNKWNEAEQKYVADAHKTTEDATAITSHSALTKTFGGILGTMLIFFMIIMCFMCIRDGKVFTTVAVGGASIMPLKGADAIEIMARDCSCRRAAEDFNMYSVSVAGTLGNFKLYKTVLPEVLVQEFGLTIILLLVILIALFTMLLTFLVYKLKRKTYYRVVVRHTDGSGITRETSLVAWTVGEPVEPGLYEKVSISSDGKHLTALKQLHTRTDLTAFANITHVVMEPLTKHNKHNMGSVQIPSAPVPQQSAALKNNYSNVRPDTSSSPIPINYVDASYKQLSDRATEVSARSGLIAHS